MSRCCDQMQPLGCEQGRLCPVRVAARSCEALGVCQHPERECAGACEQTPALPAGDPALPDEQALDQREQRFVNVLAVAMCGLTAGIAYGVAQFFSWLP